MSLPRSVVNTVRPTTSKLVVELRSTGVGPYPGMTPVVVLTGSNRLVVTKKKISNTGDSKSEI